MSTPAQPPGDEPIEGRCNARKKNGRLCPRGAGDGTDHKGIGHCKWHLGNTKNHKASAANEQARRDVALFNARRDIHPAEALLELVQWTAGEVEILRGKVNSLSEKELTWGKTREKDDGTDRGVTKESKPNIWYSMLIDASNRLERHCTAALRAGVNERLVQVAEQQGHQLVAVFVATMSRLGVDVSPGSEAARVFLEELRRLRGDGFGQLEAGGSA